MRLTGLLSLLALLCASGSLQASEVTAPQPALQQLATHLGAPLRSGAFRQQKTVAGLPLPLISSGRFAVSGQQLHWQTRSPFEAETRFTGTAIEQWEAGQLRWSLSQAEQPVVAVVSELMRALVLGDLVSLNNHFSVQDFSIRRDCWQIDLAVLDPALAQALQKISASGCARVENLQVWERNGNHTQIELMQASND